MGGCHVKKNVGFLREAREWSKGALFGGRERGGRFSIFGPPLLLHTVLDLSGNCRSVIYMSRAFHRYVT